MQAQRLTPFAAVAMALAMALASAAAARDTDSGDPIATAKSASPGTVAESGNAYDDAISLGDASRAGIDHSRFREHFSWTKPCPCLSGVCIKFTMACLTSPMRRVS
jgi:hypothetical protein